MTANPLHDDPAPDFDDPDVEAGWIRERREEIQAYLATEGVASVVLAEEPAWWVAPYVAIWAVTETPNAKAATHWAIGGDVPSDHVSARQAETPREAMRAFASLWADAASFMARGERHPTFVIGDGSQDAELAPMLASRAELLKEWAEDQDLWD